MPTVFDVVDNFHQNEHACDDGSYQYPDADLPCDWPWRRRPRVPSGWPFQTMSVRCSFGCYDETATTATETADSWETATVLAVSSEHRYRDSLDRRPHRYPAGVTSTPEPLTEALARFSARTAFLPRTNPVAETA